MMPALPRPSAQPTAYQGSSGVSSHNAGKLFHVKAMLISPFATDAWQGMVWQAVSVQHSHQRARARRFHWRERPHQGGLHRPKGWPAQLARPIQRHRRLRMGWVGSLHSIDHIVMGRKTLGRERRNSAARVRAWAARLRGGHPIVGARHDPETASFAGTKENPCGRRANDPLIRPGSSDR